MNHITAVAGRILDNEAQYSSLDTQNTFSNFQNYDQIFE